MTEPRAALAKGLRWGARLTLVLGLMGGLLVFALLLTHRPAVPPARVPAPPTVEADALTASAASEVARGNTTRATQLLENALAKVPRHAPALFLKACLAVESGPPREAEAALALLGEAEPQRPEPRLLQRLLEHRAWAPDAGWRQPFLRAWTELGRPSFVDSPLLPAIDLEAPELLPTDEWEHATSPSVRLTRVLVMQQLSEPSARWLVEHLPTVEDAALVQAASVRLLASTLPPTLRSEARATVRRRLERLVEDSPDLLQPRLLLLLARASEWGAFSEQELERLDKALEEALDLQRASDQAAPERWPLPSLWEEVLEARARDEWAHVREFTAAPRAP